ncbi:unnamed protein product [Ceutorhynchus assimilis]|uniref:Pre-mRNA-processing factor 39 n=1 Tax=Ceutorhynchus assimilis TaxID=467358 RepID=A0A9N9QGU1_9CUCU|nr:unnamed protein product [Ceutorhynchus assimilis]
MEETQQAEQKEPSESDVKLKKPPASTDGLRNDQLLVCKTPTQDIENEEIEPQRKGSKRKRSTIEEYDLVTFVGEIGEKSEEANLLEVNLGNFEVKFVSNDDMPAPPVLPGVNIPETKELSDEKPLGPKPEDIEELSENERSVGGDKEIERQGKESRQILFTSEDQNIKDEENLCNFKVENGSGNKLPASPVIKIPEIKEVSDEELPEPKHAKLRADELPVSDNPDKNGKNEEMKSQRENALFSNEEYETKKEVKNLSDQNLPVHILPETEEVSDGELPEPKRAELPADTEVVSEDELPSPKHSEQDVADEEIMSLKKGSKRKLSTDGDYKIKKEGDGRRIKQKILPKSDRYWKAVNKDPRDFTAWSYLLQFVDYDNDDKGAREAYEAFLSLYPYCFGYWRRYADYEKNNGNKKECEEVLERGLKAIPLSVDLWIHYLSYVKNSREKDEEYLRLQFERALTACSLDFRSDSLWELYIKWEFEEKRFQKVTAIFDRLLATPTLGYTSHFDNFQEYVASNAPNQILDENEIMDMRTEVRIILKIRENLVDNADIPPGDEDAKFYTNEKESKALKEHIVSTRRKAFVTTVNAVKARWEFEQGIKRPYFHIKPLERCQLKNWEDYLDYEIQQGDTQRIIVLFERCLIACALYEGFWLKYISFLEKLPDADVQKRIRDVYERSCTIYHQKNPNLHLAWANFEEACADFTRAAEILLKIDSQVPDLLRVAYARINLERRRGNFDKCAEFFEHYISNSENKFISSNISVRYSRFCLILLEDVVKAQDVLKAAITKDPDNPRLYLMLVDFILQKKEFREEEVLNIFDQFLDRECVDLCQKTLFARRKLEFIEDFSANVKLVEVARKQYKKFQKLTNQTSTEKELNSKIEKKESQSNLQWQPYTDNNYGNLPLNSQPPYHIYGLQQGEYIDSQYGQGNQYQYQNQNWQPLQDNYAGYHQWTSY